MYKRVAILLFFLFSSVLLGHTSEPPQTPRSLKVSPLQKAFGLLSFLFLISGSSSQKAQGREIYSSMANRPSLTLHAYGVDEMASVQHTFIRRGVLQDAVVALIFSLALR